MGIQPTKLKEVDEWQTVAVSDVTVDIESASGTDTATSRFLGMGAKATCLQLRTDQIITIDQIDGQTLKNPMTISANSSWTHKRDSRYRIGTFRINVLTVNTNIKLLAFTTGRRGD